MAHFLTNVETILSTKDVVARRPQLLKNQNWRAQSRINRVATLVLFAAFLVIALASEAQAQVFTKNQILLEHVSPATIPLTYDTGVSFTGTIPVGKPVHIVYGIQVTSSNISPTNVLLTITLPAAFSQTSVSCVKFPGGSVSGTLLTSACTLPTLSIAPGIGALSVADDKVIVVIDGFFTQAGPFTANFVATRGTTTESTSLNMVADVLNLPVDISIKKEVKLQTGGTFGPTASIAFGGTVTYRLTIKNESAPDLINHSTDLYLGPLLRVQDTLGTSANDVGLTVTAQNFNCTPFLGADCPTVPPPANQIVKSLGTNQNLALMPGGFSYPVGSNGFLPAGASFEITFDAVITTNALCSPSQNNKLLNTGSFTYSNGTKTVSDTDPSNNTSSPTTVTLTGLPTVCPTPTPIPGIRVEKALVSPTPPAIPTWGMTFTYEIKITNTSNQTLTGLGLNDRVSGGSGTPPFTANFSATNIVCTPACIAPLPTSSAPLVGNSYAFLFQVRFSQLLPNAVQTVRYQVQYDTPCATSDNTGTIFNWADLFGPATGGNTVTTTMAALPVCQLEVEKTQTSGPTSFASFPVTLGYKVEFKNNSPTQTVTARTIIDAMALDSPTYGINLPVDSSYTCTTTSVMLPAGTPLIKTNATYNIQYSNPPRTGIRLIDLSTPTGAVFSPGGIISCDLSVTLKQPPKNDSLCQGPGTHNIENYAFMELPYSFNTNQQPAFDSPAVITPLPDCVSIIVGKTVAPNVFAGGAVTFTLTVKNVGNDPVSNITLNDNVPPDFTNVAWTCASGCVNTSGSGNNISVPLSPIPAGATVTIVVTATAPTVLGSYCNSDKATFNPFPALTYFEGDQTALTTASACVQVKSPPEPTKPTLTKSFDPRQIGPNGTATLSFNITNSAGDPKQTGISFSDTLPAGLQIVSVVTNGCGGTVAISSDNRTLTLTGGQLVGPNADGSGQHSCQIAVKVKATGVCGVYRNNKDNFSNVTNLDVSGVNQQLEVVDCQVAPPSCAATTKEISCKADGTGGYLYTFTVTNNSGQPVNSVLVTPLTGSNFSLTPQMPPLPNGVLLNGQSTTLQVTITGGQSGDKVCFTVTLMTKDGPCCTVEVCPALPDCCATAANASVRCHPNGSYSYVFSIVNTSPNTIKNIYLYAPSGVTMTPSYFAVSLAPGATFQTPPITITGAKAGQLCVRISLHTADMKECCSIEQCIRLPACSAYGSRNPKRRSRGVTTPKAYEGSR